MIKLGQMNTLKIDEDVEFGQFLTHPSQEDRILLPKRYLDATKKVGDEIDVFIYLDSEDRIIATTETPKAMVGDIAFLKVVDVNKFGAFLDWGLMKDLFVPFKEQQTPLEIGEKCVVYVSVDEKTNRIVGSTRLNRFLQDSGEFEVGQEVDMIIYAENDFGYTVVVDYEYRGMLYRKNLFKDVYIGYKSKAYISNIREDGKIDVSLRRHGFAKVKDEVENLYDILMLHGGYLEITDKSSPEDIKAQLGVSKNVFKKAVGVLYREKKITIEKNGIRLVNEE